MHPTMRISVLLLTASIVRATPGQCFSTNDYHVIECQNNDITEELQVFIENTPRGAGYAQLTAGECTIRSTIKICNKEGIRIEGAGRGATILTWNPDDHTERGPMFSLQNSKSVEFAHLSVCTESQDNVTSTLVSAFDLYNACHDCVVETADGSIDRCVDDPNTSEIEYVPGGQPHSTGNSFDDISIGTCSTEGARLEHGIRVRLHPTVSGFAASTCTPNGDATIDGDCWNDGHVFRNVRVSGFQTS